LNSAKRADGIASAVAINRKVIRVRRRTRDGCIIAAGALSSVLFIAKSSGLRRQLAMKSVLAGSRACIRSRRADLRGAHGFDPDNRAAMGPELCRL
jgi:hypothetical protein